MNKQKKKFRLSDQPKVAHLRSAERAQSVLLGGVLLISGVVLLGWLQPGFGAVLPDGWSLMKANAALALLLCAIGLVAAQRRPTPTTRAITAASGTFAAMLALSALFGYATGAATWLDTVLTTDNDAALPGRMAVSTALYLVPAGLAVATWSPRGRMRQAVADLFATLMLTQALIITSAYAYGAWALVMTGDANLTSPVAMLSMLLLTAAIMIRHFRHGIFAPVVGMGIGSSFLRIALPWIFIGPLAVVLLGVGAVEQGHVEIRFAAALTAAIASLVTLLASLLVARKLNALEGDLRAQSLTDPLTGLHNRRGFEMLGEHRFHEAVRQRQAVALLYFDIDGLKLVNDRYGHDVGSDLIRDFADLLATNLRNSDILARLGGDEFAVLIPDGDNAEACVRRIDEAAARLNTRNKQPYSIAFSVGVEHASPSAGHTLADLVSRADLAMYHRKRGKRRAAIEKLETAAAG